MNNKNKILVFVWFFFLISIKSTITAQAVYYKGYVMMLTNDTLWGEVKKNNKREYDNYVKVAYRKKEGNEVKTFQPKKIKGYYVDSSLFLSRVVDNEFVFVKLLSSGDSLNNIYELQVQYEQVNDLKVESDYFIEKPSKEFIKIKSKKAVKIIEDSKAQKKKIEVGQLGLKEI